MAQVLVSCTVLTEATSKAGAGAGADANAAAANRAAMSRLEPDT